jgi:hypothetical protein
MYLSPKVEVDFDVSGRDRAARPQSEFVMQTANAVATASNPMAAAAGHIRVGIVFMATPFATDVTRQTGLLGPMRGDGGRLHLEIPFFFV